MTRGLDSRPMRSTVLNKVLGTDLSIVVPSSEDWRVYAIAFRWTTTLGGNPWFSINIRNGATVVRNWGNLGSDSFMKTAILGAHIGEGPYSGAGWNAGPMPVMCAPAGWTIEAVPWLGGGNGETIDEMHVFYDLDWRG